MSVTLQIIIGVIVSSWLIALCFKDFRERCKDDLLDSLLDSYRMYQEDDNGGVLYKVFLAIAVFLFIYPIIIAIIIIAPILCGFEETFNLIKASIVKNEQ